MTAGDRDVTVTLNAEVARAFVRYMRGRWLPLSTRRVIVAVEAALAQDGSDR